MVDKLTEAVKKDIELADPQESLEDVETYSLDLLTNKDQDYYYVEFDNSYKNTIEVLQEAGLYDDLKVYTEDISSIQLENYERNNTVTVEDQEDIKYILDHVIYYSDNEDSYFVRFNS